MTTFARELDVATRIARNASELIRGYHGKQLTVQIKGGDEPVTVSDQPSAKPLWSNGVPGGPWSVNWWLNSEPPAVERFP